MAVVQMADGTAKEELEEFKKHFSCCQGSSLSKFIQDLIF